MSCPTILATVQNTSTLPTFLHPSKPVAMNSRNTTRPATSSSGVRRNLFHHHLSRRPTASTTSSSATAPNLHTAPADHNNDIVIRDKNGNFQVELPLIPVEKPDDLLDKDKEEARLSEAVKHHCRDRNRTPSEPAELLAAVQASLRSKVASLSEDSWMYEGEGDD